MEVLRAETKEIKVRFEVVQPLAKELEEERDRLSLSIPNLPDKSVLDGADEEGNQQISTWGTIPDIKRSQAIITNWVLNWLFLTLNAELRLPSRALLCSCTGGRVWSGP